MNLAQKYAHIELQFRSFCIALGIGVLLAACSTPVKMAPVKESSKPIASATSSPLPTKSNTTPNLPKANSGRGGYYQDDGPGDEIPDGLESTVDPIPTIEPYSRTGNKPYRVFGKEYTPINDSTTPFKQRGVASWYGKKFHGKRTSSGEPYDMYKITAAHPILPIPSYARVTNLSNGKQIIVRINDRGPFHSSRIMDLSYTAALKLGYLGKGSSEVELERLLPEDIARMAENSQNQVASTKAVNLDSSMNRSTMVAREVDEKSVKASNTKPSPSSGSATSKEKESVSLQVLVASQQNNRTAEDEKIIATPLTDTRNMEPSKSYYLQFAAFAIRANAQTSMSQLQQLWKNQGAEANAQTKLEIVQQGNLYRLQSGPYANREAAQMAAQELAIGTAKPIVVQRP
ncbi:septal ring lytic transglycosylase RlpA family protein [Undibacterium fentianense]|nr:septal ring lytic transglycosylase RlpA family protein [Undibacterium fentianense]